MIGFQQRGDELTVYLRDEIDHAAAQYLRRDIEMLIAKTQAAHLVFDFSAVSFMDSSGVGMLIGRYKTMKARNGQVSACGMQPMVERLFRMAGLHRIIAVQAEGRNGA